MVPRSRRLQPTAAPARPPARGATTAAFLLSGAAGVLHEVAWTRQLARIVGAAAHTEALVLAVFMGGLAAGALLLGARCERWSQLLRVYAALELGAAAYGLLLPILLVPMGALYVAAARLWFASPAVKLALRLALAALAVAPPAVLLGGTLPVLVKALALASPTAPVAVARLYAVNALGAVGGTLAGGFVLQPLLGAWSPLIAAAALNVGAAALALRAGGPQGGRACPPEVMAGAAAPPPTSRPASPPHLRDALALPALALCGFAALGHEILLVRVVGLAFGSSSYAFTMMLAAFIAAVALGGWVAGITPPAFAPAALVTTQLVAAGAFLAVTPLLARLPYWLDLLRASLRAVPFGFHLLHLATAALLLAIIGVPVGCLAVAFPLVGVQMGAGEVGRVDRTGVLGD